MIIHVNLSCKMYTLSVTIENKLVICPYALKKKIAA